MATVDITPWSATNISGSSQALINAPCKYRGFSIYETTGTANATVILYDNASAASGRILDVITLIANQSRSEEYTGGTAYNGVYVSVVSGAVAGSVRTS